MKKSLIALAVFGAFSGAAMAQGSNVQLYGIIDMGLTHFTGISNGAGGTTSSTGLSSGVDNASRIGIKGSEDLGNGLSTIFDVETGYCAAGLSQGATTTGSGEQTYCTGGGFMQRQAWVGLKGDFGTVTAGRQYVPAFLNEANADPFGYGMTGQSANLSLTLNTRSPFDLLLLRWNQDVQYSTPNLSGFTGHVAYSFAPFSGGTVPTATTPDVTRAMALDGGYANGPVAVSLDYTQIKNLATIASTATATQGDLKFWQATGTYDFGVAKLGAAYEHVTQDSVPGNAQSWFLGVTVPVGAGAVLASYGQNKNTMVYSSNATAKQYAVGYTYALSKQTTLYATYAHISNDSNTAYTVGDSTDGFSGVAGQSASGTTVGIDVMF